MGAAKNGIANAPTPPPLRPLWREPLTVGTAVHPQEIILANKLGEGEGGVIYHARWRGLEVVAKMLKTDDTDGYKKRGGFGRALIAAFLANERSTLESHR